jgi:hypothetical protein
MPTCEQPAYTDDRLPVWDTRTKAFTDPHTGTPLPTWEQACGELTEPAHVVRFGTQVHIKGILGGTEEAGRHIGYLKTFSQKRRTGRWPRRARHRRPTRPRPPAPCRTPRDAVLAAPPDMAFLRLSSPKVPGTP